MPEPDAAQPRDPVSLRVAVWLLWAQAAALVGLLGFLAYADVTARTTTANGAVMITLFTGLLALLFGGFAVALRRRRGWARGPAVVLELLLVPIGYTMLTNGLPLPGLGLIAIGLAGSGSLLAPSTRAALG